MVGSQFHPEYKSRPIQPHPLFSAFVRAAARGSDGAWAPGPAPAPTPSAIPTAPPIPRATEDADSTNAPDPFVLRTSPDGGDAP
jgi:hypothetical protein